jgi:ferric-dicitrate binding protein FerR (iron transport regulator)
MLLLAAAAYFWLHGEYRQQAAAPVAERYKNDVPPGGQKAVLTLANGSRIVLDSAQNGLLTRQGNTQVLKLDSGQLSYRSAKMQPGAAVEYNVLTTPRGGQYRLTLPDGTKVWLNAASSLKFPTVFTGKSREVTLTGEAYFEVAGNKEMPFRVHAVGTTIEDIGTHFNIMAYPDEKTVKTTLLEGVVSVSSGTQSKVLKPGEQAVVSNAMPDGINVHQADLEEAVAWTNGGFYFHHTNIYEVMRQISRWYDVEVNYEDSVDVYLNGNIERDVNASEVFRMLELAGEVSFKIEGRKITVMR